MRGAAAGAVLAGVCIGLFSPAVAVAHTGMAQDLLLRWTPPEEELGLVLDIAFALGLAVSAWIFVPEFLKNWVRAIPQPWWAR